MSESTDMTVGGGDEPAEGAAGVRSEPLCAAESETPAPPAGVCHAPGAAESAEPATAGGALAARRAALFMSQTDLAARLKLAVRQIEAIERDEWRSFASAAVIKGVVRAYAKAVQADPDVMIAKLPTLDDQAVALTLQPTLTAPMPAVHRTGIPRWGWAFGSALVLTGAAVVAAVQADWWQRVAAPILAAATSSEGATGHATPSGERAESNATIVAPLALATPVAATQDGGRDASVAQRLGNAAEPASAAAPASTSHNGTTARLHIEVVQDSWIEVIDATGKVVLSALQPAGSRHDLDGSGALTLVAGNAPGVRVAFAGKPVDLTAHTRANVARVTLN